MCWSIYLLCSFRHCLFSMAYKPWLSISTKCKFFQHLILQSVAKNMEEVECEFKKMIVMQHLPCHLNQCCSQYILPSSWWWLGTNSHVQTFILLLFINAHLYPWEVLLYPLSALWAPGHRHSLFYLLFLTVQANTSRNSLKSIRSIDANREPLCLFKKVHSSHSHYFISSDGGIAVASLTSSGCFELNQTAK